MFHHNKRPVHAAKQIAVCALILLILTIIGRFSVFRSYTLTIPLYSQDFQSVSGSFDQIDVRFTEEGIIKTGELRLEKNALRIPVYPQKKGVTGIEILDASGEFITYDQIKVGPFQTVYDTRTGNFTGDLGICIAFTLFLFAIAVITFWHFTQAKGPQFYSYSTIFYVGLFLFSLISAISMGLTAVLHMVNPGIYSMVSVYSTLNGASRTFLLWTSPFILVFSVAMAVSNIELLRHERFRVQNVLGLIIPLILVGGDAFILIFTGRFFSGSVLELHIRNTTDNVLATVYVYFECMLAGSIICGLRAARHRPEPDKDFILILGCRFRRDGTLTPLLKGRADAAIAFWREQKQATGKEAVFIPSGGQGADESMPEAEAIRRYLLSQGVPDNLILPEDQSANTYQNMEFSRKLIEERNKEAKVIFSTTNYHVFRSGVWAGLAGLPAEGIGGKTKWWFWPNAFMREVIGLLQNRLKQEIILLVLIVLYFAVLSMILPV